MLCPAVQLFASRVTLFLPLYVHLIVFICARDVHCNSPLLMLFTVDQASSDGQHNVDEKCLARVSHIGHKRNSAVAHPSNVRARYLVAVGGG